MPRPIPELPALPPPLPPTSVEPGWLSEAACTLNEISFEEINGIISEVAKSNEVTTYSPIDFMHCPRGIGRPKKKRFGAPNLLKSKRKPVLNLESNNEVVENPKKRGRGRPKGSKNKSRDEPLSKKQCIEVPKKSLRQRAEDAANFIDEDENDTEICLICQFRFDDPIKKDKVVTRCPSCQTTFHEPCLLKSGCVMPGC